MKTILILRADGSREEEQFPDVYHGQDECRERLSDIVGGYIEHVHVLYEYKPTYMVVNEVGSLIPLPVNKAATRIYHAATAERKGIPVDNLFNVMPHIYGDVAVLVGVKLV